MPSVTKMLRKSSFPQVSLLLALAGRIDAARQLAQETAAQSAEGSVGNTAWDILCLSGKAGEFRSWGQSDCQSFSQAFKGKQCHYLQIRCDVDERYKTIDITWKVTGTTKALSIPKAANAVTTKEHYHRFFVVSDGCPHGKKDEDCEPPWAAFDERRVATTGAELSRRFLVYDATEAGNPRIRMETSKYSAKFYESQIKALGTGLPVPKSAVFAGSTGTDCAPKTQCAAPPNSVEPVLAKELDVTSRFIMESPSEPGHFVLMTNRNTGSVQNTYVVEFVLDSR